MADPFPSPDRASAPDTIGERIRETRKARALSQVDLARLIGVTQPAVANWESGVHDPRRLMIARIAEALAVSAGWLAGGARSSVETDKHPAAAYLRRPLQHTPVISFSDAARFLDDPAADPHACAEDYFPVTTSADRIFALVVEDEAIDLAFPRGTIIVIDFGDRKPADGAFALFRHDGAEIDGPPAIRRWRADPPRLEPASSNPAYRAAPADAARDIIGCVRVSIRVH